MAYMNQEKKSKIAAALKKVVPPGWKYSLAVRNYSTIVMTISEAPVDLLANIPAPFREAKRTYCDVNVYHFESYFDPKVVPVMKKIMAALNTDNFDKSEPQADYFCVGHYVDLHVGRYDRPFVVVKGAAKNSKKPKAVASPKANYGSKELSPAKKAWRTRKLMKKQLHLSLQ